MAKLILATGLSFPWWVQLVTLFVILGLIVALLVLLTRAGLSGLDVFLTSRRARSDTPVGHPPKPHVLAPEDDTTSFTPPEKVLFRGGSSRPLLSDDDLGLLVTLVILVTVLGVFLLIVRSC